MATRAVDTVSVRAAVGPGPSPRGALRVRPQNEELTRDKWFREQHFGPLACHPDVQDVLGVRDLLLLLTTAVGGLRNQVFTEVRPKCL